MVNPSFLSYRHDKLAHYKRLQSTVKQDWLSFSKIKKKAQEFWNISDVTRKNKDF